MSQLLEPYHITGGAVPVLLFFITSFAIAVAWSLRKKQRRVHSRMSQLPLED